MNRLKQWNRSHGAALTLVALLTLTALAAQAGSGITNVGEWRLGPAVATACTDTVLYVGAGATLLTYDVRDPESPVLTSEITFLSSVLDMKLDGPMLVGVGEGGLVTLDLADPLQPVLLGLYEFPYFQENQLCLGDGFAFAVDESGTVMGFDLTDPTNPVMTGTVGGMGEMLAYAYTDHRIYVASADQNMISVLDVTDPYSMAHVAELMFDDFITPHGMVGHGGLLYIIHGGTLGIYEPGEWDLTHLGTVVASGAQNMVRHGDVLTAAIDGDFWVFDCSFPAGMVGTDMVTPAYEGYFMRIDAAGPLISAYREDGTVFLFDRALETGTTFEYTDKVRTAGLFGDVVVTGDSLSPRLTFYDASVADDIAPIQTLDLVSGALEVSVAEGYCLATCYNDGVLMVDLTGGPPYVEHASIVPAGSVRANVLRDGVLYLSTSNDIMKCYDIRDAGAPLELGSVTTSSYARSMVFAGDYLLLLYWNSMECYDVSDPADMQLVDTLELSGRSLREMVTGSDHVFVSSGSDGIEVVTVSESGVLDWVTTHDAPDLVYDITLTDDRLYSANLNNGLIVYDVSNPLAITTVDHPEVTSHAHDVAMWGRTVVVAGSECGFTLLRDDVVTPVYVGGLEAQRIAGGALLSWSVSGTADGADFHVWRGSTEADRDRLTDEPVRGAGRIEWVDTGAASSASSYWIEALTESGGSLWFGPLELAGLPTADRVVLHEPWPNPFNPSVSLRVDVLEPVHLVVTVHDLRGRRVATLHDGDRSPGQVVLRWDGRDDAGRSMRSGPYFARLQAGTVSDVRKLMLVR